MLSVLNLLLVILWVSSAQGEFGIRPVTECDMTYAW
jgi:hypothetical protein